MGIVATMGVHLTLMGTKESPDRWAEMKAANSPATAEFAASPAFGALYKVFKAHAKRFKEGKINHTYV